MSSKIPTPHINAPQGAFAETVLMPGDPLRARFIAEQYLEKAELVNNVRNVQGYTGYYKGKKVSVMASGMGCPSIGIYSYELFNFYNVSNIIRIGSAGAISPKLQLKDIVVALSAYTDSGYINSQSLELTETSHGLDQPVYIPACLVHRCPVSRTYFRDDLSVFFHIQSSMIKQNISNGF